MSDAAPRSETPPGLHRLWCAEGISSFGNYVTLYALQVLVVLDLGGTAADTGLLNAARWLPYLAIGLLVGALVDRVRRKPVMVTTDLARAVLLGMIPLLWLFDALTLATLLIVVVVYAAAGLVNDAASQSFTPRLLPRDWLQRAHARIDGTDAVAQTAGPAIAGVLVRFWGAPLVVLVDAVTYVVSALTVASIRIDEPAPAPRTDRAGLRHEIADGVRWVYRGRRLRDLAIATHVWFAGQAIVGAILAPFALTFLGISAMAFGFVTAALGVDGLLGALCSTPLSRRLGTGGAVIASNSATVAGTVAMLLAIVPASSVGSAAVLAISQVLHGFGLVAGNSHELAYRQVVTPDALQARTNTTMRSMNRAVIVVLAPLGGLLADSLGFVAAICCAAGIFAVSVAMLWLSPFRSARVDAEA